jgi:hypothetical protein
MNKIKLIYDFFRLWIHWGDRKEAWEDAKFINDKKIQKELEDISINFGQLTNKERYNEIIKEAYDNYSAAYEKDNSIGLTLLVQTLDGRSIYRKPDIEMFIGLCTHDETFSERWGLKIEERELSEKERTILYFEKYGYDSVNMEGNDLTEIPTRIIKVTYKNETIEVYE